MVPNLLLTWPCSDGPGTLKKVLEHFLSSTFYLKLAPSLAYFSCFFFLINKVHLASYQSFVWFLVSESSFSLLSPFSLEKVLVFSLEQGLVFSNQSLTEECFFCVFLIKKNKFCFEIEIFSWVGEFLDNILVFCLKRNCSRGELGIT